MISSDALARMRQQNIKEINKDDLLEMAAQHPRIRTVKIADVQYDWMTGTSTVGDLQDAYTNNLYIRLINAGATDVHYSLFETVNVEGVNYDGHWSWIYTLRDECKYVQPTKGAGEQLALSDLDPKSTTTLKLDGQDVTLWGWLAAQVNTPAATTPEA